MVTQKANEGGGWLTWVMSTNDITPLEKRLGRNSIDGHRVRPDGTDLKWKQLGTLETLKDSQVPFFIQWLTLDHPSSDGRAVAEIFKIEITGSETLISNWINTKLSDLLPEIEIVWTDPLENAGQTGISAVHFKTLNGNIVID